MSHPALHEHDHYHNPTTKGDVTIPLTDAIIRVSSVGQADLCMGRLTLQDQDGYRDTKSEAMVFGTVLHSLVEQQIQGANIGPSLAEATAIMVGEAENIDIQSLLGDQWDAWIAEQVNLANAWRSWCRHTLGWPLPAPYHAEVALAHPFAKGLGGEQWWLAGTPDLLLPSQGTGYDWKTANKGWPPSRASGQNQQYAYSWLADKVLGVTLRRWVYVVANRSKGEWESFEVGIDPHGVRGYLARLNAAARALAEGQVVYHPKSGTSGKRGWWCSPTYCGAWNVCPARFLGDASDLLEQDTTGGWPFG